MTFSSSCARSNPARPLLGLLVWSLAIRRFAASARSCARSKSATVYCRGSGRVRFLRGPFDALLARMAALSCFAVAIGPLRFSERTVAIKHIQRSFARPAPGHRRVSQCRYVGTFHNSANACPDKHVLGIDSLEIRREFLLAAMKSENRLTHYQASGAMDLLTSGKHEHHPAISRG
jgi:hypothetical protein